MPESSAEGDAVGGPLDGRVALVTGASGGIGAATARRLAGAGARVALGYRSNRTAAEALRDELERAGAGVEASRDELGRAGAAAGPAALPVGGDLRDPAAVAELVARTEAELGPIDVLVSNAGGAPRRSLEELSIEDWDATVDEHLRAAFLLCQRLVPGMRARGFGRIVLVSSVAAFTGGIVGPHYAAAKAGLIGLMHSVASRSAGDGVTANVVAPALVEATGALPGDPGDLSELVPVGRLGRPEEVAELIASVLVNGYLTNQTILLDGGLHPR